MADTNQNPPPNQASLDKPVAISMVLSEKVDQHGIDVSIESEQIQHDTTNLTSHEQGEKDQTRSGKENSFNSDDVGDMKKPTREVWLWYLYEMCSFFVHNTLIPVLFPLLISDIKKPPAPDVDWVINERGLLCKATESNLYQALTNRIIKLNNSKFSPLEWTSFSWILGLILVAPILGSISTHLDHGDKQPLIMAAAVAVGSFFCLPSGFFHVTWIFPPYIAMIVAAYTITTTIHTRQFGLLTRGFFGTNIVKNLFPLRRVVSGWLSLYGTASGSLGSVIILAFTYHMLRHSEQFLSLWVVSIFSGLIWLVGIAHIVTIKPGSITDRPSSIPHFLSIFKYRHGFGSLIVGFLASFTKMLIFTSGVLFLIGQLCFKPVYVLYVWLMYFIFPVVSLPLIQPLQYVLKSTAVKMNVLGFFLSMATCGIGYYFRHKLWEPKHVLILTAVESTSMGLLHAFGRVLHMDCSPPRKEGVFAAWLAWVRGLGAFAGFAFGSAIPGKVGSAFGVAFVTSLCGVVLLIYGNLSDFGGAVDAGLVSEGSEKEEAKEKQEN